VAASAHGYDSRDASANINSAFYNDGVTQYIEASTLCRDFTGRPLKAESPGSNPGNATIFQINYLYG